MENKYLELFETLLNNISEDVKSILKLDKLSDAEEACLDIYNDYDSSEISTAPRSTRDAWEVGSKIAKKLKEKL